MRSFTIWILALCFALAVLVLGGLYIWFGDGGPTAPAVEPPVVEPELIETPTPSAARPGPSAPPPASSTPEPGPGTTPKPEPPSPAPNPPAPPEPPVPAPEEVIPPDLDDQLSELVTSGLDDMQVSQKIIGMMATLPESNKVEAAEFLVALLPDEAYASVVPMLTNPQTSPEVVEVLMTDLLDRPNAVQVPLLLDIARNPQHPGRADAKQVLGLYVEADYGNDWAAWIEAANKFMADNPD